MRKSIVILFIAFASCFGVNKKRAQEVRCDELPINVQKICKAAVERTKADVVYNGAYVSIDYPNGDVPASQGVCTDVVIRTYRKALNLDFQQLIHEDMKKAFDKYPSKQLWGLEKPDANIDHRRTQNIECFLKRKNAQLPITKNAKDYKPGDLVFWDGIGFGHVGIVVNIYTEDSIPMVVHNIGGGPELEDFLFGAEISGHYRWFGE